MKFNLKFLLILTLLLGAGFFSWTFYFQALNQEETVNIHLFPKEVGDWDSEEIEITEDEYAILETRNAFGRKYFNEEGDEVYFLAVYSENNRKVSHPPEVCYTGNGLTIVSKERVPVDIASTKESLNVVKLILEKRSLRQIGYYWFKVGDSYTPSYWTQQFLIAWKKLTNQKSSSALIRVSATVKTDDAEAEQRMRKLLEDLHPEIPKFLP